MRHSAFKTVIRFIRLRKPQAVYEADRTGAIHPAFGGRCPQRGMLIHVYPPLFRGSLTTYPGRQAALRFNAMAPRAGYFFGGSTFFGSYFSWSRITSASRSATCRRLAASRVSQAMLRLISWINLWPSTSSPGGCGGGAACCGGGAACCGGGAACCASP